MATTKLLERVSNQLDRVIAQNDMLIQQQVELLLALAELAESLFQERDQKIPAAGTNGNSAKFFNHGTLTHNRR